MANIMKDVARALGVELEEEFMLDDCKLAYKLSTDGLVYWSNALQIWEHSCAIEDLLTGDIEIIKLHKPILTEKEKEYLSNVIDPFKDRVICIKKCEDEQDEYIGIQLKYYANEMVRDTLILPSFKKGTMYSKMETDKEYTLEELGL